MQLTRIRLATMGLFFIFGLISASWAIHIPTVKEKFHLNDAQLSIAFFSIAAGSITALYFVGGWIERVGNRTACLIGGGLLCTSAAGTLLASSFIMLLIVLTLFGIGTATLDVSVNAQASTLEKARGKPTMSSMHCLHSVGGIAGAIGGGMLLSGGVNPSAHFISVALGSLFLVLLFCSILPAKQQMASSAQPDPHPKIAQPQCTKDKNRALWVLGGLTFISLSTESGIYDWIAVYMREHLQAGVALSSSTYGAFLVGVAAGRFIGDFLRARIGSMPLFVISGGVACIAFTAGLLFTSPSLTLISFAVAGLGFANIYPILLLAAAHIEGAQGIARVARIGYLGLLIGPLFIGGIAQIASLPIGLILIPVYAALIALIGTRTIGRILA